MSAESKNANTTPHPAPKDRWRWRIRFAVGAAICAVVQTAYLYHFGVPDNADPVIAWSYGLWGAVICEFIGVSTWDDIAASRR